MLLPGHALFPDEDVEHAFDVPFTIEDLMLINKIRFDTSLALEAPEEAGSDELVRTQERLRLDLDLDLLMSSYNKYL